MLGFLMNNEECRLELVAFEERVNRGERFDGGRCWGRSFAHCP